MNATLNLKNELLAKASELTGIKDVTALIHKGLELLIEHEQHKRMIALGGTRKRLRPIPRRRSGQSR